MLQLLGREREYIQLHRDTTVQTLTLAPSLEDGVVKWMDSPLVKAVQHGRVLLVDEADKAPLEVGAWTHTHTPAHARACAQPRVGCVQRVVGCVRVCPPTCLPACSRGFRW